MMNREMIASLAWGGTMIGVALVAVLAQRLGYIDGDIARRTVGLNGLWVAWYGNQMPKKFVANACARQVRRLGGWSMALSGLVYAGLYAFAPLSVAFPYGCAAILAGIAVTLGYCLLLRTRPTTA